MTSAVTADKTFAQQKKATQQKAAAQQTKGTQQKAAQQKSSAQQKPVQQTGNKSKTDLRNEKAQVQQAKAESQQRAGKISQRIKSNMDSVIVLNNRINRQQYSIDSLNKQINRLNVDIDSMEQKLDTLEKQLRIKIKNYGKAMTFLQRNMSIQEKIMFIFAADNLTQLFRRIRYIRDYSSYQRAQGMQIKEEQKQVMETKNQLLEAKNELLLSKSKLEKKRQDLESTKANCQEKVAYLNRNLSAVKDEIASYQKREAAIDAQINRIIQQEIEAARRAAAPPRAE